MAGFGTQTNSTKQKSLELRYTPIIDACSSTPGAYRTTTIVYSKLMGTLVEADYMYAADYGNETGVKLSLWNIGEVLNHIKLFQAAGREIQFITARCTSSFAAQYDAAKQVEAAIERSGVSDPSLLCLDFPQSLLYHAGDNARKTVMDLKNLKVKTLVSDCGASNSPPSRFLTIPVDYALLNQETTSFLRNRDNPQMLSKYCGYLKSMNLKMIADGATCDDDIRDLNRMDCNLVICASSYHGNVDGFDGDLSVQEALLQKGAD